MTLHNKINKRSQIKVWGHIKNRLTLLNQR